MKYKNVTQSQSILTGFSPSVLVESIAGLLLNKWNILAADDWALLASEANELALPTEIAVKIIAAKVL